jgi:hypothetical protein
MKRRLLRRSCIILVAMLISNVASLLLQYAGNGELYKVMDFSWWTGLFTLKTEYTISAALLPISIFLLLTPSLFVIHDKIKLTFFMVGSGLLALLTWGISISFAHCKLSTTHLMDVLFFNGSGGPSRYCRF